MEGIDLIPYVAGDKSGTPHDALYWRGGDGAMWSVLAADGTKHVHDNDSKSPQLFFLPEDVSESNDLMASQPERARELREKWDRWNEENVPCRLMGYIDYHKRRDIFFSEAVPEAAKKSGYDPQVKANFK